MTGVTASSAWFGIALAFQATRIDIGTSLKESSRVSPRNGILSRGLLVAQSRFRSCCSGRAVSQNARQSAARRRRLRSEQPRLRPDISQYHRVRHPVQNSLLSRWRRASKGRARSTRSDAVVSHALVWRCQQHPHVCAGPCVSPRPRARRQHRHQPRRDRAEFLRDDGHPPWPAAISPNTIMARRRRLP